jgi:hypothetical protein
MAGIEKNQSKGKEEKMIVQMLTQMATTADAAAPQVVRGVAFGMPLLILAALFVVVIKWGLIIWGIVWLVRYLKRGREERQLLRLELGKLADEVQRLRQGFDKSSADSASG